MRVTLESGLATGLGNLQNVERGNIGLVPCVSETLSSALLVTSTDLAPPMRHGADFLLRHHPFSGWNGFKNKARLFFDRFGTLLSNGFARALTTAKVHRTKQAYSRDFDGILSGMFDYLMPQ
jgi:hypothetical protein